LKCDELKEVAEINFKYNRGAADGATVAVGLMMMMILKYAHLV
jgi:hypothetical protein